MLARMSRSRKQTGDRRAPIDKQAAFIEFKALENESGPVHEASIKEARYEMIEIRGLIKNKTQLCNKVKTEIDAVKSQLDIMTESKKAHRFNRQMSPGTDTKGDGFLEEDPEGPEEIIDEQELSLLKQMKELKRQYRQAFNELKDNKSAAAYQQSAIDAAKTQLVNDFEQWYADTFSVNTAVNQTRAESVMSSPEKSRHASPSRVFHDTGDCSDNSD